MWVTNDFDCFYGAIKWIICFLSSHSVELCCMLRFKSFVIISRSQINSTKVDEQIVYKSLNSNWEILLFLNRSICMTKFLVFTQNQIWSKKHEECNECLIRIDVAITNWRFRRSLFSTWNINLQYTSTCYKTIKNAYPLFTVVYGVPGNEMLNVFKCFQKE